MRIIEGCDHASLLQAGSWKPRKCVVWPRPDDAKGGLRFRFSCSDEGSITKLFVFRGYGVSGKEMSLPCLPQVSSSVIQQEASTST